jgi:putative membrane protein
MVRRFPSIPLPFPYANARYVRTLQLRFLMIAKSAVLAGLLFTGLTVPPAASAASGAFVAEAAPDTAFLQAVHQADLAEIAAGGIAKQRGVSPRVRALGARFIRDHKAIDARLTKVARAAGVTLPDTPTAAELKLTKKYQSVPAASFDRLYLRTQLAAHAEAMAAGQAELATGQDQRVKRLVRFAAPLVKAHHDALNALYGGHAR